MQEVVRDKNSFGYDVFTINTDTGNFEISFQNNGDLYWRYIHSGSILDTLDSQKIIITKENYYIYELFDELYENIKAGKVYNGYSYYREIINNLYKDGKIEWYSDEQPIEITSKLIIEKEEDIFKVTFQKNKIGYNEMLVTYAVRISNSGSRHRPFNISFTNMYNKLKDYDFDNHQVHIEEVIYKQKILKKHID